MRRKAKSYQDEQAEVLGELESSGTCTRGRGIRFRRECRRRRCGGRILDRNKSTAQVFEMIRQKQEVGP